MVLNGTCTSWQEKTPCEYIIRSVSCACWLCHSVSQWSVSLALSLGIWQRVRYKLLITVTKCLTEAVEGRKGEGEEGREEERKEGEGDRRRKGGKKRGRDRLFLAHGSRGYSAPRRVRGGSRSPCVCSREAEGAERCCSAHFLLSLSSHTPLAPRGMSPEWFQIYSTSHVSEETWHHEPANCCSLHATLPSDTEAWHL